MFIRISQNEIRSGLEALAIARATGRWDDLNSMTLVEPWKGLHPEEAERVAAAASVADLYIPVDDYRVYARRAAAAADRAVRVALPIARERGGKAEEAAMLRSLPPIVDEGSAEKAKAAVRKVAVDGMFLTSGNDRIVDAAFRAVQLVAFPASATSWERAAICAEEYTAEVCAAVGL